MLLSNLHRLVAALMSLLMVLGAALPLAGHACAEGRSGHAMDSHAAACCSAVHTGRLDDACAQHADCALSQEETSPSAGAYLAPTPAVAAVLTPSPGQPFPRPGVQAVIRTQQQTTGISSVALHLLYVVFLN